MSDQERLELAQQQLQRMEAVAEGPGCREQALLLAVGELVPPCGRCDSCLARPALVDWSQQAAAVLALLEQRSGLDLRRLAEALVDGDAEADGAGQGPDRAEEQARWCWLVRRLDRKSTRLNSSHRT